MRKDFHLEGKDKMLLLVPLQKIKIKALVDLLKHLEIFQISVKIKTNVHNIAQQKGTVLMENVNAEKELEGMIALLNVALNYFSLKTKIMNFVLMFAQQDFMQKFYRNKR